MHVGIYLSNHLKKTWKMWTFLSAARVSLISKAQKKQSEINNMRCEKYKIPMAPQSQSVVTTTSVELIIGKMQNILQINQCSTLVTPVCLCGVWCCTVVWFPVTPLFQKKVNLIFPTMIRRLSPPQTGRPLTSSPPRMDRSTWTCTPPRSIKWTRPATAQVRERGFSSRGSD